MGDRSGGRGVARTAAPVLLPGRRRGGCASCASAQCPLKAVRRNDKRRSPCTPSDRGRMRRRGVLPPGNCKSICDGRFRLAASARDILRDADEATGDRDRSQIGSCRYNIRPKTLSLRQINFAETGRLCTDDQFCRCTALCLCRRTCVEIHARTLLHTSFLADRQRIEYPDRRLCVR